MGRSFLSKFSRAARQTGIAGLTLGTDAVALACLVDSAEGLRIAAADLQAVNAVSEQGEALKSLVKNLGAAGMPCVLTLEQDAYSLLQIEKPPVGADELRQAARWRIKDLIDYPVEDAVVDVFEIPGLESRGRAASIYVAAARKSELQRRVELIQSAGLALEKISITEMALRNLAVLHTRSHESVAVLQMSDRRGLVTVVRDGALYVARTLDYGLAHLEELAAVAGDDIDAAASRQEVYDRITLELQRTLDYYDSYFAQPPVQRLALLPATAEMEGLAAYARSSLGLEAAVSDLGGLLSGAGSVAEEVLSGCASAALGAMDAVAGVEGVS